MIGNDVVDLEDAETRAGACHPRFDARVFDPAERAALTASTRPDRLRWILWAAKESAYKAARREAPDVVFAPQRFAVRLTGPGAAVQARGARFRATFAIGHDHVHAVARRVGGRGWRRTVTAVTRLDRHPPGAGSHAPAAWDPGAAHAAVRELAISRLAPLLGVEPRDLAVVRDGRMPALWLRGRPTDAVLSLSHHGRFVAFACALPVHGAAAPSLGVAMPSGAPAAMARLL